MKTGACVQKTIDASIAEEKLIWFQMKNEIYAINLFNKLLINNTDVPDFEKIGIEAKPMNFKLKQIGMVI